MRICAHRRMWMALRGAARRQGLVPRARSLSAAPALRKGSMVEFHKGDRKWDLAVLDKPDGKKNWFGTDRNGIIFSIRPQQIAFTVPGDGYNVEDIGTVLSQSRQNRDPELLRVAWEILQDEGNEASVEDIEKMMFSTSSPATKYATHRILSEDVVYFKRKIKKGTAVFEPRKPEQVHKRLEEMEKAKQRVEEEKRKMAAFEAAIREAIQLPREQRPKPEEWRERDVNGRLEALESMALNVGPAAGTGEEREAAEDTLLKMGYEPSNEGAHQLLSDIGMWGAYEILELRRKETFGLGIKSFKQNICEAAEELIASTPPDADQSRRVDLTSMKVLTIDDESTTEIDDGVGFEDLGNGRSRVWIHIADPTRWVHMDTVLEREARRRTSTVYLPTGSVPMFPRVLSDGPFSLRAGQKCCAFSIGVVVAEDGSIESYDMIPSLITPKYRLTYDDADELLSENSAMEPELTAIAQVAESRRAYRTRNGAVDIALPETNVKVKNGFHEDAEIDVYPLYIDSPSRKLVAELMILAGEVTALAGTAAGIALPYRGQPTPDLPPMEDLLMLPEGPCREIAKRSRMTRSVQSYNGAIRHASLGLAGYCQVSSPIRRYGDMLVHYQMKAHLRGTNAPLNEEELALVMDYVGSAARETQLLQREVESFWTTEFFRRQPRDRAYKALLLRWLREDSMLASVLVEEFGIETAVRMKNGHPLGAHISVGVSEANPRAGRLFFEEW